ncbi:MAG: hypothetical protein JO205_12520 [Pseudolabrys sp.]|nr:hypothetical protein [Pseudolabrys sp.]
MKPDLRLRRACHHRAVRISHDNVTQPQRCPACLIPLDLRTADRYRMFGAEIFFDC